MVNHLPLPFILECLHSQNLAVLRGLLGGVISTLSTRGSESLSCFSQVPEYFHLTSKLNKGIPQICEMVHIGTKTLLPSYLDNGSSVFS